MAAPVPAPWLRLCLRLCLHTGMGPPGCACDCTDGCSLLLRLPRSSCAAGSRGTRTSSTATGKPSTAAAALAAAARPHSSSSTPPSKPATPSVGKKYFWLPYAIFSVFFVIAIGWYAVVRAPAPDAAEPRRAPEKKSGWAAAEGGFV